MAAVVRYPPVSSFFLLFLTVSSKEKKLKVLCLWGLREEGERRRRKIAFTIVTFVTAAGL